MLFSSGGTVKSSRTDDGVGFTIDVGSTTLALELYDLHSGTFLAGTGTINPQSSVAADVIGRIAAADTPEALDRLRRLALAALEGLLAKAVEKAGIDPSSVRDGVVTGNTVMLHILFGKDPSPLGVAPFRVDWHGGCNETLFDRNVWVPPSTGAFTGADLVSALIAADFDKPGGTALLCDIGTNAEVAVRHEGKLYVTSTAAGPAFEGTGVRGSALLDAIAHFRASGAISETGECIPDALILDDGRKLTESDVRAVQMAKAAVAAGINVMLDEAGAEPETISLLYLAGGFGSGLDPESAEAIGMLPSTPNADKIKLSNAALTGAAVLLLDPGRRQAALEIARDAVCVELGGNPAFSGHFIEALRFG